MKQVVVQMDQAGGHGGGRSNMTSILSYLNDIGASEQIPVTFITQPSRYVTLSLNWILMKFTDLLILMH